MTNIFAIAIPDKEPEYIFCVADSQTTSLGSETKFSSQKMVQRGSNILMNTGSADIKYDVFERTKGKDLPPGELAELILKETEVLAKKFENNDNMATTIFIAGRNKDKLEMHNVDILNTKYTKRGAYQESAIYSNGSGMRHVGPALSRDFEKGYQIYPKTPLEALMLCFSVGAKADTDLGVNEKLQISIISKNTTRLILPPGISGCSWDEWNAYLSGISGVQSNLNENSSKPELDNLKKVSHCVNNFYQAFETEMRRLIYLDDQTNKYHAKFKTGEGNLGTYTDAIRDREAAVKHAQIYFDALMKGGVRELNTATRQFYESQRELMKNVDSSTAPTP